MSGPVPEDSIPSTPSPENNVSSSALGVNNLQTTPRDSIAQSANAPLVTETDNGSEKNLEENAVDQPGPRKSLFKRPIFLLAVAAAIVVIVLVVILPVYFTVIKTKNNTSKSGNPNGNSGNNNNTSGNNNPGTPKTPNGLISGGDGSTVTMENGTQFTYQNSFGGFWYWDPQNPFTDNAQPNSWTPPLNQTWQWGVDQLYGVNIGGWFVLEPFITPSIFQPYAAAGVVDEWTLSTLMAADTTNGGLNQLEKHYDTFISEEDFAQIAGAGLNWIRLPIPFWAIDVWPGEPFLERTCWTYILRAFQWARKYGLRVMLDLHTAPGSQNGFNHSGKQSVINLLLGDMGVANAQRMINYIRIFTEFISQPEYANVVPMFGIVNEIDVSDIGIETVTSFNLEVYNVIRSITGVGEGKGPFISISDGFVSLTSWANLLPNADRIAIDTHPYFAFDGQANTDPINVAAPDGQMGGTWLANACSWKAGVSTSQTQFGVTIGGEYSNGINDCGFYLNGVPTYTPLNPNCAFWDAWEDWDQNTKAGLLNFALASMDALENPFFWTWKIGPMTNGSIGSPLWSYKLGLDNGWMPKDPRQSQGKCAALGVNSNFSGTYLPWQTGGSGAGSIPPTATVAYPWPPATISGGGLPAVLPQYTPTGSVSTLPPPTFTATKVSINGWYDSGDTAPAPTPIPGCPYPNAWAALSATVAVPIANCPPVLS